MHVWEPCYLLGPSEALSSSCGILNLYPYDRASYARRWLLCAARFDFSPRARYPKGGWVGVREPMREGA